MKENLHIRVVTEDDADQILNIYSYYILNTAITFEYDVPSLQDFKKRISTILKKYPYIVAEIIDTTTPTQNKKIVGYAYASSFKNRPAYNWAVETSIYIDKKYKNNGIGKLLYSELENFLSKMNILNMNACIAFPELDDEYLSKDSVFFHKAIGFTHVGEFHKCGFKFNCWYNMIWMEKEIGCHTIPPKDVCWFDRIL